MIDINEIITQAVEKDASDIHLMQESKPMYRIGTALVKMEGGLTLKSTDMYEIYDYFTKGNAALNKSFNESKTLYTVYEYNGINLGINMSLANNTPVYTMKILKNQMHQYEDLGLPDILRKMTHKSQGLILVAGNKKSGKTTTLNALVRHINETQNKKIITLEKTIEYTHMPRNSIIIQKEVGVGRDFSNYAQGIKNAFKEDSDILVIEDIRNKETMDAVLEMIEEGHLIIAGINSKTCIDAIDKIINFYNITEQNQIKYELSTLLKLVISQKILLGTKGKLELLSEVMVVDSKIKEILRKEQIEIADLQKEIQNSKQSVSLMDSLAKLYIENKITLKQAKALLEEKDIDTLNKTIMKMRINN